MKKHDLYFNLRTNQKMAILSLTPIEDLDCCADSLIIFLDNTNCYILANSTLRPDLEKLILLLNKALKNELQLSDTIKKDLGLLMNEDYQSETGLLCSEIYEYLLLAMVGENPTTSTWLYNNPDGSIVFEIAQRYPWVFDEKQEDKDFVPYQEWIKSYKPYLITTIPHEVAQQWLEQATALLAVIEENIKKEFSQKNQ